MTNRLQTENNLIMRISSVIGSLLLLNLLTLLCSLPIITVGGAVTAMHDGLIRIVRKEEGYVARRYFKVFKENLKQGILLWLPFLFIFAAVGADLFIQFTAPGLLPDFVMIPAGTAGLLTLYFFQWIFPVHSRFRGGTGQIFRTSFFLAVARFPRTIAMTLMWILPVLGARFWPTVPLVLLFGISGPGILCTLFYYPVFAELEEEPEEDKKGQKG